METGSCRGDVKAAMTFILEEEEPITAAPALARPEPRLNYAQLCMGRFDLCQLH
jgi:hypothetical protein